MRAGDPAHRCRHRQTDRQTALPRNSLTERRVAVRVADGVEQVQQFVCGAPVNYG